MSEEKSSSALSPSARRGRSSPRKTATPKTSKPKTSKRAASPVARRRAARRKPAARGKARRLGAATGQNQLLLLERNIAELKGDLLALKTPADKAHDAIEKVKAPLQLPGKIKGRVQKVKNIAKGLDSLARLVGIVPGPIGSGAKALHQALVPLLGERGVPGVFDQVISALGRVEKALKPVVTKLNQVEKPIDAARHDLAGLLVHVGRLEGIAHSVRAHYGETPPAEVQACLGKLNEALALIVKSMAAARKRAAAALAELAQGLDKLRAALKPLNDIARDVERTLAQLDSKVVDTMTKVLTKIAKAVKPILDAADWLIKNTIERILELFKINLDGIKKFFRNLVNALNPFKGLQQRIDRITNDLAKRVAALPAVKALVSALDQLAGLERQLDREIEKIMRGACRAVLMPESKAAARRRVGAG